MFKKKPVEPTPAEKTINALHLKLESMDPTTDEYAKVVKHIVKLAPTLPEPEKKLSKDVKYTIMGNLLGVGSVLWFEKANVVTSKAFNMLIKPKI